MLESIFSAGYDIFSRISQYVILFLWTTIEDFLLYSTAVFMTTCFDCIMVSGYKIMCFVDYQLARKLLMSIV